jgi:hypothetical protein
MTKRLLRDLALILLLAGFWAVSGYMIGAALETIGFDTYRLSVILASINLILGMTLFLRITKDPTAERIFFQGPEQDTDRRGYPQIGCLWLLPIVLLIYGASMWFWAIILRLIFPD